MSNECGIYCITNTITDERYVGSAKDISARWSQHRADLQVGRHRNWLFQHAYNNYGAAAFEWTVLEVVPDAADLRACEARHIETLRPEYNLARILQAEPRKMAGTQIDADLVRALQAIAYNRTEFVEQMLLSDPAIRDGIYAHLGQRQPGASRRHPKPRTTLNMMLPKSLFAALDGAVNATSSTRGDYLERLLRHHPAIRAKLGTVPSESLTIELPADLLDALDAAAPNRTAFIERAIRAALAQQSEPPAE